MEKLFLWSAFFLIICFFSTSAFAYDIIEFKTLPATITTNIQSFPITGTVPSGTKNVLLNEKAITFDSAFFSAIDLNEGENRILLKLIDSAGKETVFSRQIIYNPAFSVQDSELIYANVNYYDTTTKNMQIGTLVIEPRKSSFLGLIKGKYAYGVTKDGKEVILGDSRYFTGTNSFNKKLQAYSGGKILLSDNKAFYSKYRTDLATNSIDTNLPKSITSPSAITEDGKKIFLTNGSIDTATNVFSSKTYSSRRVNWGDIAISPDNKYALTSGFDWASSQCNVYDNNTGALISTYSGGDYAGDIVFSPDGKIAYCGHWGNTYYGKGGIRIIDLAKKVTNYISFQGPRSLVVSNKGTVFASAFSGSGLLGVAELIPIDNGANLQIQRVFFARLIPSAYYNMENIFYKQGSSTECYSNSDCGTEGWIETATCQSNDSYQNYKTFSCNNPGTTNSSCKSNITQKFKQDCQDTTYEAWDSNYCNTTGNVEKSRIVHNKVCDRGACTAFDSTEKQTAQTCQYGCGNKVCNPKPACSKNSDCGKDGWIDTPICSDKNIFQNYKTYSCVNPNTQSANCTSSTSSKLKQGCGETTYGAWSANYCDKNGNIEKNRTVHNKGCASGKCTANDTTEKQAVQTCAKGCSNGTCITPKCTKDSDCGTNAFVGGLFCLNGNIDQNYQTFKCNNPSTAQANCTNTTTPQLKQTCTNGCNNGTCNSQPVNDCNNSVPLYRFWNSKNNDHFYTTSETEKNNLIVTHKEWNYVFEGIATYVYSTQKTGTTQLYRFWNTKTNTHLFTASETEKNTMSKKSPEWVYEGIAAYIYPTQQTNKSPLYRFWNSKINDYFYTTSETEKNNLIVTHKEWNYSYEGITGYTCKSKG